ncbi:O-antigen ligase [Acaryochloris marina]|uniref:O-antigen ligase family protein n=1 Tax=Acaryochloris marina TaxID=155978 RepID=UPI001BAFC872|nr:hypothetical protein [Acaryochloris marina]QUY40599.1 hypothetical protein I1H34_14805 [Acaryochloris marina S15]
MATMKFEKIASAGDILRWLVLLSGCALSVKLGFVRAGRSKGTIILPDRFIIMFLYIFLASAIWSILPIETALKTISLLLLYVCSFWTLWEYTDSISEAVIIRNTLYILGFVMTFNLVYGIFFEPASLMSSRFQGIFENPNNIGLVLGLALPLVISRWLITNHKLDLTITIIFLVNLLLSGNRTALFAFGVAIFFIFRSLFAKNPIQAFFIPTAAIIFLEQFIQTNFFAEKILREDTLYTAANRTYFWELAQDYITNRPDFGHGFGTEGLIHNYYGTSLYALKLRGHGVMSSYFGLAVQIGWPLTYLFFGLLWGFAVFCLFAKWRNYQLVTLAATIVSGLVIAIFEPAIYSAGNCFSFLFWMVLMLAIRRLYYQKLSLKDTTIKLVI